MDTLDWFNTIVGVVGLLLALVGIFYSLRAAHEATKAAERASELLMRVVVYPFRELDGNHASLTPNEVELLDKIFQVSKLRKTPMKLTEIRNFMPNGTRVPQESLELLASQGWLTRLPGGFGVNAERVPYLTFLNQAKNGEPS